MPQLFAPTLTKALSALCLLLCLSACDLPAQGTQTRPSVASDDVIAILDQGAPRDVLLQAAQDSGYRLVKTTPLPGLNKVLLTFQTPAGVTGQDAIAFLEAAEPAATVGVNHAYRLQVDAAGSDRLNYAQALMDWPATGCRARMAVGVIDTGVDPSAPGLRGARVLSRSFGNADPQATRHGTDVASILANPTRVQGLTLYNANVVARDTDGTLLAGADALIEAIDWMARQNVRVINMSLAGPFNKILEITVDAAAARGLILVASVGNAGPNAGPFYPAAFGPVIGVTAVDADAQVYRQAVRGPFVDVAAPGVDIFVPSAQGGRFVTGTSFAAAFVTARIAAEPQANATASAAAMKSALTQSSDDLGPSGIDRTYGAGLVKAPQMCR